MIHLVYAGPDLESYMVPLRIRDTYVAGQPAIPALGWRTMAVAEPVFSDPLHVAKGYGSVQIILRGAIRITVSAGSLREWVGRPGDAFVFVDLEGCGHGAEGVGSDPLEAINIRLSEDWDALTGGFDNWPAAARRFPEGVRI